MLQNASYTFLKNETKQSDYEKKKKKAHPAGVEPKTFDVQGQRLSISQINCPVFNIFCPWNSAGGRCLKFMTNWKIYSRETSMVWQWKYLATPSRSLISCWRLYTAILGNQSRFSKSKHFRFYWTKKLLNFISEWNFAKNHETWSLVVRKVKK